MPKKSSKIVEEHKIEEPKTKKRVSKQLTPKEQATKKKEPYISVLSVELDKNNPGNGSFELDWNDYFIIELKKAGYPGKTNEETVDNWFREVCRNVLLENFEQEIANRAIADNPRYIDRRIRNDGKTEVS